MGIRLSSLLVYISTRKIKARFIGGRWRIRDKDLEEFIETRRVNRGRAGRKPKPKLRRRRNQHDQTSTTMDQTL